MPFAFKDCDCSPLVIDNEFSIQDENLLAEYVGKIVLGHYAHVKKIINRLSPQTPVIPNEVIDLAIEKLNNPTDIEKRDGWVFQIISWLVLVIQKNDEKYYCQQPHDAPAQHGIDGIGIILNSDQKIKNIIITEDKCTTNHRNRMVEIWSEFRDFEKGDHDNKIVNRLSPLLEHIDNGVVLEAIQNDLYSKDLRKYRVGINRNSKYEEVKKRKKLFKGYDSCILDNDVKRRTASTMYKDDIRGWMEGFSQKVVSFLQKQKTSNV
ncbi:hypothetical protein QO206_02890 [Leeuwenhoekiella aequorea]|uniref:hypothetical protein n=1 Tax=Leeuwenhoekiella aequorea TaxID=283736 RepID=UPI00352C4A3B